MASKRAQKSEVHQTTDDASTSPASAARTPRRRTSPARGTSQPDAQKPSRSYERDATDKDMNLTPGRAAPDNEVEGEIGGGPGAGDASSGGGAGAGIPGGGTDMRMGEKIPEGNVEEDRSKLFPDSQHQVDESDLGGPVRIETDDQGRMKQ